MENHQLINQTSGKVNYVTPPHIIEAARATMGGIELDPASSMAANKIVQAKRFFSVYQNGLELQWDAESVWLNHPYSRKENKLWIEKAVKEFNENRAIELCMITYAATSELWFCPLMRFPICFLHKRVSFLHEDGTVVRGNTKGSCVTYMGNDIEAFALHFLKLGTVMVPETYL